MKLTFLPEHNILRSHTEPAVAHLHFRNEAGCERFVRDNRKSIRGVYMHWSVDWEPMLTVTAAK